MSKNANKRPSLPAGAKRSHFQRAFTLIELLTVMTMLAVAMVAVFPALRGLSGGNVNQAVYDIAGTLEQARAYAMANNTYVFVGFAERSGMDAAKPGTGNVLVAVMGSRNGTRSFGAGNANLVPLAKVRRFGNVHLENSLPALDNMSRPAVQDQCRIASDAFQAQNAFTQGGQQFSKIIQFDPRGMAGVPTSLATVPERLEIGLVAARGDVVVGKEDCAAVIVDGVTGSAKIYRP
jgi:prepilin-type N-terminal cleavage/methylation domain-containing protein